MTARATIFTASGDPAAVVISARQNRDYPDHTVVTVRCPFCRGEHLHGDRPERGRVDLGLRVPHCGSPGQYRIVDPRGISITVITK